MNSTGAGFGPGAAGGSVPAGYVLIRVVGRGASAVVWEATQVSAGRSVALKLLDVDLRDADARGRFERERQAMAALSQHPHIVALYDAGVVDHHPWLALQLCGRGSYAAALRQHGPMPPADALDVLIRVGEALVAAHAQGVLHCDVKPANIMITDYGTPALTDFGVARGTVSAQSQTVAGGYSLDHVAPEVLDNTRPTVLSDVYSLATTVWELLCGRGPFRDDGDAGPGPMVARILRGPLPQPIVAGVPPEFAALLARMASVDPALRPQSMADAVAEARALQSGRPVATPGLPPAPTLIGSPDGFGGTVPPAYGTTPPAYAASPGTAPPAYATTPPAVSPPPGPDSWTPQPAFAAAATGPGAPGTVPPWGTTPPDTAGGTRPRRKWPVVAAIVVVVALLAGGGTWWFLARDTNDLVLQSATGASVLGAFTTDFSRTNGLTGSVYASAVPKDATNRDAVPGSTDGLYRGVKGSSPCDRDGLSSFLTGHADIATAWVTALRTDPGLRWSRTPVVLSSGDITPYFRELTPVLLSADTRATVHGWTDGAVEQSSAVLQAGTAVLVDAYGIPRVRCAGGNPLTAPGPTDVTVTADGAPWPGFDRNATVAVVGAGEAVRELGLVDLANANLRRPAGSTGGDDFEAVPANASLEGAYVLKGQQANCNLSDCAKSTNLEISVIVSDCNRRTCTVRAPNGQWAGNLTMTVGGGGVWTVGGTIAEQYGYNCNGGPIAATFTLTLSATGASVQNTEWAATGVNGRMEHTIPATGCTAGTQTWNVSATK
ncbi:serine/threonine-protein kinase [Pseudonocardia sp. N23]|uniref:serine/threonine-protein kinase n=1 Tax=Pseudonocardia sp. N23 TaxID=1987376 RepID=UPI000C02DDAF|nr:serine/threonine-protein kinase [Pseudonocardia sp. N23]GAY11151.1 transcriptional activator of maltose regulon, MalT [Pseudonocardia sp. N23]